MLALGLLLSRYEVEIWARVAITNMFFHVGQKTNLINKNRVKIVYLFSFFKVYLLDTSSIASRGEKPTQGHSLWSLSCCLLCRITCIKTANLCCRPRFPLSSPSPRSSSLARWSSMCPLADNNLREKNCDKQKTRCPNSYAELAKLMS